MAEHQLDDPDVDAIRQQPARAFVSEVVPAEIDPLQLLTIPRRTLPRRSRFDAVSQQSTRFPGGLQFRLVLACCRPEHVRVWTECRSTLEDYLTGNPLSPDVRFVQNGPSIDGWTSPAHGRGTTTEEPTITLPAGRGRGGRGAGGQSTYGRAI